MITTPLTFGKSQYDWRALIGTVTMLLAIVYPNGVMAESVKALLPSAWEAGVAMVLEHLRGALLLAGSVLAAFGKPILVEAPSDE